MSDSSEAIFSSPNSKIYKTVLQVLSLPLLVLGTINVIKTWYGIQLIPVGENLLENYRIVVHYFVDALYFFPKFYFKLDIPPIVKDLITISICLSTINWKAFSMLRDGDFDGRYSYFDELLTTLRYPAFAWLTLWNSRSALSQIFGLVDFLFVLVESVLHLIAWFIALPVFIFTQSLWLSFRALDTVYVFGRGMALLGYYLPVRHLMNVMRAPGVPDEDYASWMRRGAAAFYTYLTAAAIAVVAFFGSLGVGGVLPLPR